METSAKMKAVSQAMSGRWLLTVTAGACLMIITCTACYQGVIGLAPIVDPSALLAVLTMVFMSYFNKPATGETEASK